MQSLFCRVSCRHHIIPQLPFLLAARLANKGFLTPHPASLPLDYFTRPTLLAVLRVSRARSLLISCAAAQPLQTGRFGVMIPRTVRPLPQPACVDWRVAWGPGAALDPVQKEVLRYGCNGPRKCGSQTSFSSSLQNKKNIVTLCAQACAQTTTLCFQVFGKGNSLLSFFVLL